MNNKRFLATIFILCISMSLFAMGLELHLGMVSGLGIMAEKDKYSYGIDLESSFPVYAIVSGYSGEIYNDLDFRSGFDIGAKQFVGLDFYLYRTIAKSEKLKFSFGFDLLMGTETPIWDFETVLKATARLDARLGQKTTLFIDGGISVLDIMMAKGFKSPLVRIPDMNYFSILTGSKLGLVIHM